MMNFSPFFKDSEVGGLVAPSGFGFSFSATGFAAKRNPRLKNRTPEMMRKMKIGILNFDFIIPPKTKAFSPHLPSSRGEGWVGVILSKCNVNSIFEDFK
jgi:hypothetical protein